MKRKILSIILSISLIVSFIPLSSAAEDDSNISASFDNDGKFTYVAVGDSIAAGFSTGGITSEHVMDLNKNYKNCSVSCYPYLFSNTMFDVLKEAGYISDENFSYDGTDFEWSNLGIPGYTTTDWYYTLNDDEYIGKLNSLLYGEDTDYYKYHEKTVSEIEKADIITFNMGANNLLIGFFFDKLWNMLYEGATVEEYDSADYGTVSVVKPTEEQNPAMAILITISFLLLGENIDDCLDDIETSFYSELEYLESQGIEITTDDVIEILELLGADSIQSFCDEAASSLYDSTKDVVDSIHEINPDAKIIFLGNYNPYGNSLEYGGEVYNISTVISKALEVIYEIADEENNLSVDVEKVEKDITDDELLEETSNVEDTVDNLKEVYTKSELEPVGSTSYNDKWGSWNSFINWSGNNIEDWYTWSDKTWNSWAEMGSFTEDNKDALNSISKALESNSLLQDGKTNLNELSSIAGIDIEDLEYLLSMLTENYASYFTNLEGIDKLAVTISNGLIKWDKIYSKFINMTEDEMVSYATRIFENISYPITYLMLGQPVDNAIKTMNENNKKLADENNMPFIDIYDISNENNTDPHPDENGHLEIANLLIDQTIFDINISTQGNGSIVNKAGETITSEKIIYGFDAKFYINTSEGTNFKIYVDGQELSQSEIEGNSFTVENITSDVEIKAVFGSSSQPSTDWPNYDPVFFNQWNFFNFWNFFIL